MSPHHTRTFTTVGLKRNKLRRKTRLQPDMNTSMATTGPTSRTILRLICISPGQISGTNLEVTVSPGQNVTVNCDCKRSTGVYIVWYRNCSHENQPTMVLNITREWKGISHTDLPRILHRFQFKKNLSSGSYDLQIWNITKSDEGLYYCGTEEPQIVKNQYISYSTVYKYGNVTTRIIVNSSEPQCHPQHHEPPQDCGFCWILLVSLCTALLYFLLCSAVVCLLCRKKEKEDPPKKVCVKRPDITKIKGWILAEDACLTRVMFRTEDAETRKKGEDGPRGVCFIQAEIR